MSSPNDNEDDKNKTASAIIEMLKDAGVSTSSLEDEDHKFWNTQVRVFFLFTQDFLILLDKNKDTNVSLLIYY